MNVAAGIWERRVEFCAFYHGSISNIPPTPTSPSFAGESEQGRPWEPTASVLIKEVSLSSEWRATPNNIVSLLFLTGMQKWRANGYYRYAMFMIRHFNMVRCQFSLKLNCKFNAIKNPVGYYMKIDKLSFMEIQRAKNSKGNDEEKAVGSTL